MTNGNLWDLEFVRISHELRPSDASCQCEFVFQMQLGNHLSPSLSLSLSLWLHLRLEIQAELSMAIELRHEPQLIHCSRLYVSMGHNRDAVTTRTPTSKLLCKFVAQLKAGRYGIRWQMIHLPPSERDLAYGTRDSPIKCWKDRLLDELSCRPFRCLELELAGSQLCHAHKRRFSSTARSEV